MGDKEWAGTILLLLRYFLWLPVEWVRPFKSQKGRMRYLKRWVETLKKPKSKIEALKYIG